MEGKLDLLLDETELEPVDKKKQIKEIYVND